ncbi:MAG: hypothetical protein K6E91_09800 [Butyrivibrio sp.]|nr:hypothetical protein [Butyrivibrio sp.]
MAIRIGHKVYVETIVKFTDEGIVRPLSIEWEDGTRYEISRVKDCVPGASRRAGGAGIMYTCIVDGKEIHLYYEDCPSGAKWFLESKK